MRLVFFAVFCLCGVLDARTDFSAWKDSLRVYFNTGPTGAALTAPVKNFPLLIRLDSTNFSLSAAAPGGADIRFTDPDGAELPAHVERWDTGFYRSAEIWVNVPQVDAGSATDYVVMYWGNPKAVMTGGVKARQGGSDVILGADNAVASRVVFDTAFGFSGVWHLDEDVAGIGTKKAHRDATPAGNHGDDSAKDASGSGVAGRAQQFDAVGDYIVVPNAPNLQLEATMSFSAWIKSDKFSGIGAGANVTQVNPIVRKGDINNNPYQFEVAGGMLSLSLDSGDGGGVKSPQQLETGKWLHVGGVWDGKKVQLYLNGAQVIDKEPPNPVSYDKDIRPTYIGGRPVKATDVSSLDLFDGAIDEVQVSRPARGKDWFKLSYENQKPGSALLKFTAIVNVPKDTVDPALKEDYSTWAHSRKVFFNTTGTGADVKSAVKNFPVLIRLKSPDAIFNESDAQGNDVRAMDADGTHIPVSIEWWAATKAVLWVRVPQIEGGGKSDYITLFWGKPGAPNVHAASAVFDTADGWSGVWHLDGGAPGKGAKGVYQDATGYHNNGDDNLAANPADGLIGLGQSFGGSIKGADCVRIPASPSLAVTNALTISAWVKGSTFYKTNGDVNAILRKGDANPNNYDFYVHKSSPGLSLDAGDGDGRYDATVIDPGQWYHLAATLGGGLVQFYVNGAKTSESAKAGNVAHDERPLFIGGRDAIGTDSSDQFDGMLDEVEFSRVERGADWIKLAYENQRLDSRLIEFDGVPVDTAKPADTTKVATGNLSDTVLAPGQSIIRNGQIKVGNAADAGGSVRVRFLPAQDQGGRGIADAGEIISLQPSPAGGVLPAVSIEINSSLSGNVSLFLGIAGKTGPASVHGFGEGIGSWLLYEAGEYFLGRDTLAPVLNWVADGITDQDSSWIKITPVDNVENLTLILEAKGLPGGPDNPWTDVISATAGKTLRLAFKGDPGSEYDQVTLKVRDGNLDGRFPAPPGTSYPLVRRLSGAKAPLGLAGNLAWKFVGIPVRLKEHIHFSDVSGGSKDKELFGAIWRNDFTKPPGEYLVLKGDDTLPTSAGIWLAGRAGLDSLALGEAFTNTPGSSGIFRVPLTKGWNQVTSPVLAKVPWPLAAKDTVRRDLSRVKALQAIHPVTGAYTDADSLEPWRGFFVYSQLDTTVELTAPGPGAAKPAAPKGAAAISTAEAVPVQVVLEPVPGGADDLIGAYATGAVSPVRLGAARYAVDGLAVEDEPMPPAAADRPSLAAVRSGHGLKSDLLGYLPAADYTWKLAWSARDPGHAAGPAVARLRVASLRLPAGMVLWAASPLRKIVQPAVLGTEMDVQADAADTLIFWAAPAGRIFGAFDAFDEKSPGYRALPLERTAGWLPGPDGGSLLLALPATTGVHAECLDASGRTLASLRRAALAPGYYEFPMAHAWARGRSTRGLMIVSVTFMDGTGPHRLVLKTHSRH